MGQICLSNFVEGQLIINSAKSFSIMRTGFRGEENVSYIYIGPLKSYFTKQYFKCFFTFSLYIYVYHTCNLILMPFSLY